MFWQHKTKYTAQQVFNSPQQLLKAAQQYFKYIDGAASIKPAKRGKKAVIEQDIDAPAPIITTHLPYTMQGLCVYLGVPYKTFVANTQGEGKEALEEVALLLRDIIETQQFTGAALGVFSPTVITRKPGLTDKPTQDVANPNTDWKITLNLNPPNDDEETTPR